jgi:hypothetical protein
MQGVRSGAVKLIYEPKQGFLRSVLRELRISPASQILVFSKTSLQSSFISPNRPRAIYFNDRAYVGWIPGAPHLELIGIDPKAGPVFFTLDNRPTPKPTLDRQTLKCFQCHYLPITGNVPGLMARSVFAGPDGTPRLAGGSFATTAKSPMNERWGGWYVSGLHGSQRHMGNEVARGSEENPTIDTEKGANVTDLSRYFGVGEYLTRHSDIVALMVAEQQMEIQNLATKAGFETRRALKYADTIRGLKFEEAYVRQQTQERIEHACEPLVQALVGANEAKLTAPVKGSGKFSAEFSVSAPADKSGRRLSELDLTKRLLRYRCSPMIYSPAVSGLPNEARAQVYKRLRGVLSTEESGPTLAILRDTLPEFGT